LGEESVIEKAPRRTTKNAAWDKNRIFLNNKPQQKNEERRPVQSLCPPQNIWLLPGRPSSWKKTVRSSWS
jgi:hypothetical protein